MYADIDQSKFYSNGKDKSFKVEIILIINLPKSNFIIWGGHGSRNGKNWISRNPEMQNELMHTGPFGISYIA